MTLNCAQREKLVEKVLELTDENEHLKNTVSQVAKKSIEGDNSTEIIERLEIQRFLACKSLEICRRALIDNEIDW